MSFWADIKFFTRDEFRCPCAACGGFPAEPEEQLVRLLDEVRRVVGRGLIITSGVRCKAHNTAVGGVPDSPHLTGHAADIAVLNSRERYELLSIGLIGFSRIGIGKTFIHFDTDPTKASRVVWLYGEK